MTRCIAEDVFAGDVAVDEVFADDVLGRGMAVAGSVVVASHQGSDGLS
jgi:predicted RNA-binding protein